MNDERKLTAADVMTPDVSVAKADWSIEQLTSMLSSKSISGAPVVDAHGKVVGVVSLTDVTRGLPTREAGSESDRMHQYYATALERQVGREDAEAMSVDFEPELTVGDIMTPLVFEVEANEPVQKVADQMLRGRIHRVFVKRDGELAGVISAFDMLRVVRDL